MQLYGLIHGATERKTGGDEAPRGKEKTRDDIVITACFIIVILSYAAVRRPYNKLK